MLKSFQKSITKLKATNITSNEGEAGRRQQKWLLRDGFATFLIKETFPEIRNDFFKKLSCIFTFAKNWNKTGHALTLRYIQN